MKKLINYILNGKGLGIRWLAVFSAIMALIGGWMWNSTGVELIPYVQKQADQLLPVKIENGKIVEPVNTIREVFISPMGLLQNFRVVLDTTVDSLNPDELSNGIYFTRTRIYTAAGHDTRITLLPDTDLNLPKTDYSVTLKEMILRSALFIAPIMFVFEFALLLVLALFYNLTAWIIAKLLQRTAPFDLRMRLSSCGLIMLYGLSLLASSAGTGFSHGIIFVLMLIGQTIFMLKKSA